MSIVAYLVHGYKQVIIKGMTGLVNSNFISAPFGCPFAFGINHTLFSVACTWLVPVEHFPIEVGVIVVSVLAIPLGFVAVFIVKTVVGFKTDQMVLLVFAPVVVPRPHARFALRTSWVIYILLACLIPHFIVSIYIVFVILGRTSVSEMSIFV